MARPRRLLALRWLGTLALCEGGCSHADREALLELYNLTGGAGWARATNWADGDPCAIAKRWFGVGVSDPCDRWRDGDGCALGRVTSLHLPENNLSGVIANWSGLAALSHLSYLDLGENSLSGSLPSALGMLARLEVLRFSRNAISGTLPSQIGLLNSASTRAHRARVQEISFDRNRISGTIPPAIAGGVHNDPNKPWLDSTLPIEGQVHTHLESLDLSHNARLSGTLPPSLGTLEALQLLRLDRGGVEGGAGGGGLSGTLPAGLGELRALRVWGASRQQLSGSLPQELGGLTQLGTCDLSHNRLSGSLPASIGELAQLRSLQLSGNGLQASLPEALGNLSKLEVLDLFGNAFQGDLPASIAKLRNLQQLYLDREHLQPLRNHYCRQRLPDLGKYSWRLVRDEYRSMTALPCEGILDTAQTFGTLREDGTYELS